MESALIGKGPASLVTNSISVEFLGMPGSGKSTLSRRVGELLLESGVQIDQTTYVLANCFSSRRRIAYKAFYALKGLLCNPRYSALSSIVIAKTGQRTALDLLKGIFNWLFVSSVMRQYSSFSGIALIDEGNCQALWSISYGAESEAKLLGLENLAALMPIPAFLVIVDSDISCIEMRLQTRERHDSRIEKYASSILDALRSTVFILDDVINILEPLLGRNRVRIIRVKNDCIDDMEESARRIASAVYEAYVMPAVIC